MLHVYSPFHGQRHDTCSHSQLELQIDNLFLNRRQLAIYGDTAYNLKPYFYMPFKGTNLTAEEITCNCRMSHVHNCVEWGFRKQKTLFTFTSYFMNQKILLQPVGNYFLAGTLLTNYHTCLYGSVMSSYFRCAPLSLWDYLF